MFMVFGCVKLIQNAPECTVKPECVMRPWSEIGPLQKIVKSVQQTCTMNCSQEYFKLKTCLQNAKQENVVKTCALQWNARCTVNNNELCLKSKCENWIANGATTLEDVEDFDKYPIECTACQSRLLYHEIQLENVTEGLFASKSRTAMDAKCGTGFYKTYEQDNNTDFVQALQYQQEGATTSEFPGWAIALICVLGGALFLTLLIIFIMKNKKKVPLMHRDTTLHTTGSTTALGEDYDDYYNPRRESMISGVSGANFSPNFDASAKSDGYQSSYISKPF